jgi:hypothetical protein
MKKLGRMTAEFIVYLSGEFDASVEGELPQDEDRCTKLERNHCRRRRLGRAHSGNHKYTEEGSISMTTAMELVNTVTVNDIKAVAGLDDLKVLKGRDNWIRM